MPKDVAQSEARLLSRLIESLGPHGVLTSDAEVAPFMAEERGLFHGQALAVLRPRSVEDVAMILAEATQAGVPVVAQGGNTGLVGGAVARGGFLLSLQRLDRIRALDPVDRTLTVEAGTVLKRVQEAAEQADCLFPLSLGSEGTATVGGLIATNAGGASVLRYGTMRELVLGLEVVLADGRVWNGLRALRKDNAGYDLKQLFIGSEGTLGIVTAAVVKLFPKPKARCAAFVGLSSPMLALALLKRMQDAAGETLTAFELISSFSLEIVVRHISGTRRPLADAHAWYVLLELSSPREDGLAGTAERILAAASEQGEIQDAVLAASDTQRAAFWRIRDGISEAQKHEGGSIKHDVSVPVSRVPELIERGIALVEREVPGVRPCPFGHIGDGNVHFNFSQPLDWGKAEFLACWDRLNRIIHDLVHELGGSIAAEHGIGLLKRSELAKYRDETSLHLMRGLKQALDPAGILNPGKVAPDASPGPD